MPTSTPTIRACGADDFARILDIINRAAVAYRGVIPDDCWHEPYMTADQLRTDMAAGVSFLGLELHSELAGVMGIQSVRDVDLIRHAYVLPDYQRHGVGGQLMRHLLAGRTRRILVGTWADATWAIAFYERHGFTLVDAGTRKELLGTYWNIPSRQSDVSVVLARPATE